ncbi:MAG: hypothetical protein CMJ52_00145 [Planctomycetaceae bacterium]|nr:hypothetical protein [Planctomycetaceae bacterium]
MATKTTLRRIESLLEKTETAMKRAAWFEAERHAVAALDLAIESTDHESAARACVPLQAARHQRAVAAIEAADGHVDVLDSVPGEIESVEAGVYLVEPNGVGADARRLRIAALQLEVPVLVVCREPVNRMGLVTIVAIGGSTVRARVEPPADLEQPDLAWTLAALERLGDEAIEGLDPGLSGPQRIDALRAALDSVTDHERLHHALAEALRDAAG